MVIIFILNKGEALFIITYSRFSMNIARMHCLTFLYVQTNYTSHPRHLITFFHQKDGSVLSVSAGLQFWGRQLHLPWMTPKEARSLTILSMFFEHWRHHWNSVISQHPVMQHPGRVRWILLFLHYHLFLPFCCCSCNHQGGCGHSGGGDSMWRTGFTGQDSIDWVSLWWLPLCRFSCGVPTCGQTSTLDR